MVSTNRGRGGGRRGPGNRGGRRGPDSSAPRAPQPAKPEGPRIVELPPSLTVKDLAERMALTPVDIIKALMKNGVMATINQEMDYDTAAIVAGDLGWEVKEAPSVLDDLEVEEVVPVEQEDESLLEERPPVVTVMGHVDHGKTLLLDAIRSSNVAAREAGGITQHIGAYQVVKNGHKITFLDTPGHAAFTAMRARGAQATDVAIIVVAADDGVMPQTVEAIDHAKAAGVPIVVALNKVDKADANVDRVLTQLNEIGLNPIAWGGQTEVIPVSAKTGEGIPDLLETVLLTTEIADLKANPNKPAQGVVIEARMERARGPMATMIVQSGTLHTGDAVVAGSAYGRVRAMFDDRGKPVKVAPPGTPVAVLGLNEVPEAGDKVQSLPDEKVARSVAVERAGQKRAEALASTMRRPADILAQISTGETKQLNIVLKADTQGSIEAIEHALNELNGDEVKVKIIRAAVGPVTESDVLLADASQALIIGFTVRPDEGARRAADSTGVQVKYYDIIYKLIEDIEIALSGMHEPVYEEVIDGHAEVRATFKAGRTVIAGCYVTDGDIRRNAEARVLRGGELVTNGRISSLKRFKEDAREVSAGYECGIVIDGFNDFQEGDVIEAFGQRRVV
ncbi:MAG TPA: translation initiation factor IF-2 [Chloroflexota bacterium]|nr:translation initiation factor IF-2 [Chloroflexota bacterium]